MTRRPAPQLWTLLFLVLLVIPGCGGGGDKPAGIILITLDTTRADRLGCYGNQDGLTPAMDELAEDGATFTQAQAPVPVTLPSHASMFTGQVPVVHGVRYNGMFHLGEGSVTVAELLRDAGWATAGMPAAYPLTATTGIDQGFDTYRDMFTEENAGELADNEERPAGEITRLGLEWLKEHGDEPFFLWLHYYDPHAPYAPPFPFSARYRDRPYDGEVAYTDQEIGRLLDGLKESGLYDETVILVAGDHGEGLFEHGEKMHANLVYQSTLAVPLIVKAVSEPGGIRLDTPVSVVDVAPTILDFAGLPVPEMDGNSLRPFLGGDEPPIDHLYFESLAGSLSYAWSPLEGLRRGRWKYIRSVDPELFDLESDPGELTNLYSTDRDRAAEMDDTLTRFQEAWSNSPVTAETVAVPMDPEELARLESLGYVGGALANDNENAVSPRAMIHLERPIQFGKEIQLAGKHVEALRVWRQVLDEDPENRHVLNLAAVAALNAEQYDSAVQFADRLTLLYPEFVPGHIVRGEIFITRRDYRSAAEAFQTGVENHPEEDPLIYRLAAARLGAGDLDQVVELSQRRLDGGEGPHYRILLAAALAGMGKSETAEAQLQLAIDEGYERRSVLEEEPLLAPLRSLPGFEDLVSWLPEG